MKTEILFGFHPVFEALRAGRRKFYKIYLSEDRSPQRVEPILKLAESMKIPVTNISSSEMKTLSANEQHQGICAETLSYQFIDISRMLEISNTPFLLILDHILDPHNLGALIRTALCAGVNGVIIPKDRSASPTPTVSKISAGALEHIALFQVNNIANTIKQLKTKGLWIIGADRQGEQMLFNADLTAPTALVIGSEEKGIRPLVKQLCDFLIAIPQNSAIGSLNASVAGGIIMYEIFRQRQTATDH